MERLGSGVAVNQWEARRLACGGGSMETWLPVVPESMQMPLGSSRRIDIMSWMLKDPVKYRGEETMYGALQSKKQKYELTMEMGGWVQVTRKKNIRKSSQNRPIPVLIFYSSIPCVFCLYIAKVVGYYDLSVLSMSVMGFQKIWIGGWAGGVSSIQFYFSFWIFLTLPSP